MPLKQNKKSKFNDFKEITTFVSLTWPSSQNFDILFGLATEPRSFPTGLFLFNSLPIRSECQNSPQTGIGNVLPQLNGSNVLLEVRLDRSENRLKVSGPGKTIRPAARVLNERLGCNIFSFQPHRKSLAPLGKISWSLMRC